MSSTMLRLLRLAARPGVPGGVALRPFHLDDIGAEIAKHLGRVGAEHHGRQVDDAYTCQRSGGSIASGFGHGRASR
jgi:hypothetical protein